MANPMPTQGFECNGLISPVETDLPYQLSLSVLSLFSFNCDSYCRSLSSYSVAYTSVRSGRRRMSPLKAVKSRLFPALRQQLRAQGSSQSLQSIQLLIE